MRFQKNKIAAFFAIATIVLALLVTPALAEKTIKWKAQALWSAAELSYKTFVDFTERVKVLTNGRLEITPYPGGAIVPTFELLEAVQNNVLQAMHSWPGYNAGKEPAFAAISDLIAGYSDPWQKDAWMYYMGGWDLLNELYEPYNVYSIGWMFWGIESMVSTKPIRRMEDFKGLKMRVPQGMTAMLMQKLGASVVVLPGGEVFSALDKGVIDASDWASPSMNQRMGFFQVAKYFNNPGFHSMPFADFAVNKDEWNKLPDDIKAILKTAAREWAWDSLERIRIDDIRAIAEMKEKGVTALAWSEEDLTKVRAVAMGIWDEYAKKSPMTKKVIDSQKDWLRKLELIE